MKLKILSRALLAVGMTTALAAGGCDGTSVVGPSLQAGFGDGFAALFNAPPNNDPGNPMAGDVIALDLTADPVNF